MTQTDKSEINKLHKWHPYRKLRRASRDTVGEKFKKSNHTYSVVLFTGLALFAPMLVGPPAGGAKPLPLVESSRTAPFVAELLSGVGGPEMVPVREVTTLEKITLKLEETDSRFDIFNENEKGPEKGPEVTVTKVYNHLKVANTVMPTTNSEIASDYGWRTPPCRGCSADHKGVDFVPGFGKPIFAVADGMVIKMGSNGGYGNYVKLAHLVANSEGVVEEWETLYAHMRDDSFVEGMIAGSVVKSGETIGEVGNTGMSTGPHLHFELIINGEHVDPLPLLGTYEVIIVTEEDYPDFMFVGETIKKVETVVAYE